MLDANEMLTIKADVFSFIKSCSQTFDLIFADPPYDLEGLSSIPTKILEHNLLKPNGIFIIEHSKKNTFIDHPSFTEERKYGNVHFSFFSKD